MVIALALLLLALENSLAAGMGIEPSASAPGGLEGSQVPQFILFTHDDPVSQDSFELLTQATKGRSTPNGCPVVATLFVQSKGTDCDLLQELYDAGFEVADHTVKHPSLVDLSRSRIEDEILSCRSELADCGIPESDILGFRAPLLETKPEVRQVLHDNGFLYDSSLTEETEGHSFSGGMDDRIWPWDLGNGIPINCDWYGSAQQCDDDEDWEGLVEVPVWDLTANGRYTMDPGKGHGVYEILMANFDAAYNGNRAPLPIFIHTPWLEDGDNLEELQRFMDDVLELPDVYFVTMRQLIGWMEDPVSADELTPEALGCGNPGGAPGNNASDAEDDRSESGTTEEGVQDGKDGEDGITEEDGQDSEEAEDSEGEAEAEAKQWEDERQDGSGGGDAEGDTGNAEDGGSGERESDKEADDQKGHSKKESQDRKNERHRRLLLRM